MYTPPPDKVLHFATGSILASIGRHIGPFIGFDPMQAGLTVCAAGAIFRELYNLAKGGKFDLYDIAATMAGSLPAL